MMMPIRASSAEMPAVENVPASMEPWNENIETSVASLEMTRPEFLRPMIVMNRPTPAVIAYLRFMGMALKIASRTLVSERITKMMPSTKIAVSAVCQE